MSLLIVAECAVGVEDEQPVGNAGTDIGAAVVDGPPLAHGGDTLGSPLGLRTVVHDRLRPDPSQVPPTVTRWDTLVDRDDLVAAHLDLASYFPPATGSTVAPVTAPALDNGAKPHDAQHYLTKKTTGRIITAAVPS